jgi:hypothetical protein
MKFPAAVAAAILLAGSSLFGQTLFSNFNGVNPFTHGYIQRDQGLTFSWSPTGGIADSPSEAGCVVSAGSSGKAKAGHIGAPTFSLNNGMSYTISEYVHLIGIGATGDMVLGIAFGQSTVITEGDSNLVGVILQNLDGTNLGIIPTWQDPNKLFNPSVQLTTQPALGDWVRVMDTVQETDVATGAFAYTVQVDDFGATGAGVPTSLLAPTSGTFADAILGGHGTAGWFPGFKTTVPGNAFDDLAATPTPGLPASLVAAKGDVLETSTLTIAGPPAIDSNGDVAIHATVVNGSHGTETGIVVFTGTTFSIAAGTGDAAPGTGGAVFASISDPALTGSGALAFYGRLKPGVGGAKASNDAGIWVSLSSTGAPALAVRTSGTAPDDFSVPVTYSSFSQLAVNDAGGIGYLAGLHGAGVNAVGLFGTDTSGSSQLISAKGPGANKSDGDAVSFYPFVPLPTAAGQSRTFDTVVGNGAIIGELSPPYAAAIGRALNGPTGFDKQLFAETDHSVPHLPGVGAAALGEPIIIADGDMAFPIKLEGTGVNATNNSGIAIISTPFEGLVVRTGSAAPDSTGASTSGTFTSLDAPVMNNNDGIAFVGSAREPGTPPKTYSGIWSSAQGAFRRLVQSGDPAPGGGRFAAFTQIVLPDVADVIFTATLAGVPPGQNVGVFQVQTDGSITLIQRTGVLLPVYALEKTVAKLGIFQTPPYVTGQSRSFDASTGNIVYETTFTDGAWAIYELIPR